MRLSTLFVYIVLIFGFSVAAVFINHSYRKEDKDVVSVLKEKVSRLEVGLAAANLQLETTAFRLGELEKAAKSVEGTKVSKADFDNAMVGYNDDSVTLKPVVLIVAGMYHKGYVGTMGKDFLYGGRVWFQVVGKMPGLLTLYRFVDDEWLEIDSWEMDIPRTIQQEDIPASGLTGGRLSVGRYRLEFKGRGENKAHAEHEFSIVSADKPAVVENVGGVTLSVLDQTGNPLLEEIAAGTPMVFQLTLPAGEKGEFMLVPATVKGGFRALGKKDVTGPRTEKILESDLSESALQDGHLKPGEYQIIYTSTENGVFSKNFTILSGK